VFQTISLADRMELHFQPSPEIDIAIAGNIEIEDNLIARAAHAVFRETGQSGDLRVRLSKRIPMGAGLGGGSSDAAAILLSLPGLLGCPIPPERLHMLAAELGSDVPFFLYGGAAVGIGRGEELFPLPDLPRYNGLLITPEIYVSTAEAYGSLTPHLGDVPTSQKQAAFGQFAWTGDLAMAANDFEAPVFARHPELGVIRDQLAESGAICARMTGSGSSLFAFFADRQTRVASRTALRRYRTIPFSLVSRASYRRLWERQTNASELPERSEPT
jgi:4-diphosphocytidyl-2-C-methyl-D-erythritol kinase